jgi:glutamate dehydrogenase
MISFFDISKLSSKGYRILCEDNDVTLPSGEKVTDGTNFRNTAHFRYSADILVPCESIAVPPIQYFDDLGYPGGGRPEAVSISNVHEMFFEDGQPRFKYIVEGGK